MPSFFVYDNYRTDYLCGCQPYLSLGMPPDVSGGRKGALRKVSMRRDEMNTREPDPRMALISCQASTSWHVVM